MTDLDAAWQVYQLMAATGWRFLPYPGGLLDQPEWLIDDLLTISYNHTIIERMMSDG